MIGLDVGPASDDADVEPVDVGCQSLVDSFLELQHILGGSDVVECGKAGVLKLDEPVLHDLLVVLGDLDCAQVCCSPVITRHVSVVVQKFFQIVVKGVCGGVGMDLHNSNKLLSKSPGT